MTSIIETARRFIQREFLPLERPDFLTESTELIRGGILDSIGILDLVAHLEEVYGIEVAPAEVDEVNFGTLAKIEGFVSSKVGPAKA